MPNDFRIYLYIVSAVGLTAYAVSFVPALTSGGSMGSAGIDKQRYVAAYVQEMDHCQEQSEDIDCQCFANVSAMIQADVHPKVPNVHYANKQELARWQAADSC